MTVLVGCSGWSYDDWAGRFYPVDLTKKKGEWLAYYARFFETAEINSTYYRPPGELQVRSWIKKAKGRRGGFEYSVKMPGLVTHRALVEGDEEKALSWTSTFNRTCLSPISGEGLLGGVLFQLPPSFRRDERSVAALAGVLDSLVPEGYDLAVEFRHRSWLDASGRLDPAASDLLMERNVAAVQIDGPGLTLGFQETADHVYIRFHGRNRDIWRRSGGAGDQDHRLNRYDYLYKREELMAWIPRIKEAERRSEKVRIYFNNHPRSKAARNAFDLMDMLWIDHEFKEIDTSDQRRLGEF